MIISGMNNRITFEKRTMDNSSGFEVEKWVKYKTVWCSANNLYGQEWFRAKEVAMENTITFVMMYNASLVKNINTKDYRIIFNKKIYNIESIDNVKYENEEIKIRGVLNE